MKDYITNLPDEPSFVKHGLVGRIVHIADDESLQIVHIRCPETGHVTTIRQNEVDFRYYIIDGVGEFIIEDEAHSVKPGDTVNIPKGTKFTYVGAMELILISTPSWFESQEDIIS